MNLAKCMIGIFIIHNLETILKDIGVEFLIKNTIMVVHKMI